MYPIGVVVPTITAFRNAVSHRIDEESTYNLAQSLVSAHVHGLFPLGRTGEFGYLTLEEKVLVARAVCEAAKGSSVPVYVGVSAKTEEETKATITRMDDLRRQGLPINGLVLCPLLYRTNETLLSHIIQLPKLTDLPFILYTNPGITNSNINPEILQYAPKYNIIALKDSSGSLSQLEKYIKEAGDSFSILQGSEVGALAGLRKGADGLVPSLANLFPRLFVHLYRVFMHPETSAEDPDEIQDEILSRLEKIHGGSLVVWSIKTALREKGVIKTNITLDDSGLSKNEKAIAEAIEELI